MQGVVLHTYACTYLQREQQGVWGLIFAMETKALLLKLKAYF
jgi:hypothetical protein